MKRNLFAILLALTLVVALAFVVAPTAKAIEVSENTSIEVKESCTIDLNGHNVTVNVNNEGDEPIVISVVDNGNRGKNGLSAGKLTIGTVTGSYAIETVSKDPDANMRYLKVDNGDTTYSFHPFNLVLKQIGINTGKDALCLQAMFIANDKVQEKLSAKGVVYGEGEWAIDDLKIGATGADSKGDSGKYSSTNGIGYGYYDLMGSLADQTAIEKTRTFRAYITVDGEPIYSDNIATFSPKTVLETLDANAAIAKAFSAEQRAKMKSLIDRNDQLKELCYNFTHLTISNSGYVLVTDISDLKGGDQIIIAAAGEVNYALSTTQNDNNRGTFAVNKVNNTLTFEGSGVEVITLEAGTKDGTFAFKTASGYLYAASSGSNHLKTQTTNNDNGSWNITIDASTGAATIIAQGSNTRNYLRYNPNNGNPIFACYASTSNVNTPVAIYKPGQALEFAHTEIAPADCENAAVCEYCGEYGEALGHDLTTATCTTAAECTREGCDYVGEKDADNHPASAIVAATCKEYKHCSACEAVLGDEFADHTDGDDADNLCDYGCGTQCTTAAPAYKKISTAAELTNGSYVIICSSGNALGNLSGSWVTISAPTVDGNEVVDTADAIWTLEVNGSNVKLKDANGTYIAPKTGNTNGIQSKSYDWAWSVDANGNFTFKGTGSDTTTLAQNGSSGFRAYKNTTASGYPHTFTLYKLG